ncbi:MAG: hypothetical protein QN141_13505 [Armatimonadota bacterium]|nr:hypothetical protein [Armatimonadota bacterium]MDR7559493.1 hypothetical protein [Armatimonadota bacterium]
MSLHIYFVDASQGTRGVSLHCPGGGLHVEKSARRFARGARIAVVVGRCAW